MTIYCTHTISYKLQFTVHTPSVTTYNLLYTHYQLQFGIKHKYFYIYFKYSMYFKPFIIIFKIVYFNNS